MAAQLPLPPRPESIVSHAEVPLGARGNPRALRDLIWLRLDGLPEARAEERQHRLELSLDADAISLAQMDRGELWSLPYRRVARFEGAPTNHRGPEEYAVVAYTESGTWWYVVEELTGPEAMYIATFLSEVMKLLEAAE